MPAPKNQRQNEPSTLKKEESETQVFKPEPLKTLLTWSAPERLFKKRDREYFTTLGAIVFLLIMILLFLKEWFLIIAIIALTFVSYVMSTIEPRETGHKITNRGVITANRTYRWEELTRFWFKEKWGQKMVLIETLFGFPRHLTLLLGGTNQAEVKKILSQYLLLEKPEKTWLDNASEWLSRRIPLEK